MISIQLSPRYSCALVLPFLLASLAGCSADVETRKQAFVTQGDQYVSEGKLRDAVIEFRNAIQLDPKFGAARSKLADTYAQLGEAGNALGEYVRAADLLPEDAKVQITAGNYLMAIGRVTDAKARAEGVLKREPNNIDAHILLGNALGGLNSLDQALDQMDEAIRLDPARGASYLQLGIVQQARGRPADAEAALQKAISLSPKWVGGHLALANFYWSVGKMTDAERSLGKALELDARNDGANRAMAMFSLSTGRIAEAEQYLKRVAENSPTPSSQFALADYYMAAGRLDDAIKYLETLAEAQSTADGARPRLARAYASAGQRPKAFTLVEGILKDNPKDNSARLLQGQLFLEDGRPDDALESLRTAVAADPNSAPAQFTLGKVHAARGDTAGAETAFREVLKLNPRATPAQVELSLLHLSSGDTAASMKMAEEATRIQPQSFETRLALVRSLLASRSFARAQREIEALMQARPKVAAVHVQAGVLAASRNNTAGARSSFGRALELDPESVEAFAGLLALDLNAKDFASVKRRVYERVDKGKPSPELLLLGARTLSSVDDIAGAERLLKQAIETAPSMLPAYSMLGQLYIRQNKLDEARAEFDRLASKQSRPVGALTMSGTILQVQGNLPQARQRFEQAVAIDPRAAVAANNLAWIYVESNEKLEQAVKLAHDANEVLPDVPEVLDTLGWAYYKSDLPALAITPLARCVTRTPTNAACQYHVGLAYAKVGDTVRAKRALERALELRQDFPLAAEARRVLAGLGSGTAQ